MMGMGILSVAIKLTGIACIVGSGNSETVESNRKNDKYESADVEMVFNDVDAVLKFLGKNLEKLVQEDEYDSAFVKALKE